MLPGAPAQVIPLYDNCGGSVPIVKHVDFFVCADSDPLSQAGTLTLFLPCRHNASPDRTCVSLSPFCAEHLPEVRTRPSSISVSLCT